MKGLVFLSIICSGLLSGVCYANSAKCYEKAINENLFAEHSQQYERIMILCSGQGSQNSVECYRRAIQEDIFKVDDEKSALFLCAGNSGPETVECYKVAYEQVTNPLLKNRHALNLCSPRKSLYW